MKAEIHLLALNQIIVDPVLQSRVTTSLEYQRKFSEAMLRGDEFPPVTVFNDGQKYWLADGFHRYGARLALAKANPRFDFIRAIVLAGGRREASIFSAGANQKFSIPRTPDDLKKSINMLLDDPEWRSKPLQHIAEHVGVSRGFVDKSAPLALRPPEKSLRIL